MNQNIRYTQRGLGMIEVLVTIVILALGLLGVTSLQFAASKSNADALARSQAVFTVSQFNERLRSAAMVSSSSDALVIPNVYFDSDLYNFANLTCSSGELPYACHCEAFPSTLTNCDALECDVAQTAAYDAYHASCQVVQHNPVAELSLTCIDNNTSDSDTCSGGSRHVLMVRWPQQAWQNQSQFLDAQCNPQSGDSYACVTHEVFF